MHDLQEGIPIVQINLFLVRSYTDGTEHSSIHMKSRYGSTQFQATSMIRIYHTNLAEGAQESCLLKFSFSLILLNAAKRGVLSMCP